MTLETIHCEHCNLQARQAPQDCFSFHLPVLLHDQSSTDSHSRPFLLQASLTS
jgi:hypothetical protein